jgi:hypothetical protein
MCAKRLKGFGEPFHVRLVDQGGSGGGGDDAPSSPVVAPASAVPAAVTRGARSVSVAMEAPSSGNTEQGGQKEKKNSQTCRRRRVESRVSQDELQAKHGETSCSCKRWRTSRLNHRVNFFENWVCFFAYQKESGKSEQGLGTPVMQVRDRGARSFSVANASAPKARRENVSKQV